VSDIAKEFGFKVIRTENQGLSSARNTGMNAATGVIVAYIDDDARPDPHWLMYLAHTYVTTNFAGVGGPNIAPAGDGSIAECVANAPGGPIHVLTSDREAEHIPGCNMSFRKEYLVAIDGFDSQFRIAGDDVDACWRIQEKGGKLGFNPAAMVWHHRRNSIITYLKQQVNYGKAEALLEKKWPQKYNTLGHLTWCGRLYGHGLIKPLNFRRWRVYHGIWGSGMFQSLYAGAPGHISSIPLMPEWYYVIAALFFLGFLGLLWMPLLFAWLLMLFAICIPITQALISAFHAEYPTRPQTLFEHIKLYIITTILFLAQPLARLSGRLRYRLTPWRRHGLPQFGFPRIHKSTIWSERWESQENRLEFLEQNLLERGAVVTRGGSFDRWDIEVRGGLFGLLRIGMAIEEHSGGKQLIRFHSRPYFRLHAILWMLLSSLSALAAFFNQSWLVAGILGLCTLSLLLCALNDCGSAMGSYLSALKGLRKAWNSEVSAGSQLDVSSRNTRFTKQDGDTIIGT
jgi:GT2 family glycosyltransferase